MLLGGLPNKSVEKPCVGVLFVHGAGEHGLGSTLVEFGEPLIAWLDGWLRNGKPSEQVSADKALTGASQIITREGDASAPAHSLVRLRPKTGDEHTWLLAEARWDQAFTPPGFQQVLLWSLGVVPWTVLTQFIGPLARQARFVESNPLSIALFMVRVAISAILALIASAFVLVLAFVILILSIIPIEAVRGFVGRLQRFASSGVGDLYIVLTSPIQRAALSSAVQRDIAWLRKQGCDQVAVVAHSQGGYVAYQALSDPWHPKVELFITFGSGLVRLTESERARRTSSLVLALIGTVGALIALRFLPLAVLGQAGIWEKHEADTLAFAIGTTVSLLLVVVLWRYFHDRRGVADLPAAIPWYDYLTAQDPVMNRHRRGLLPNRVRQIRVQNRGSVRSDHSSYWKNGDQFVPQVARQIGKLDPGFELMDVGPRATSLNSLVVLAHAIRRRRGRVAALRRRRIAAILATVIVLLILQLRGQLEVIGAPVDAWIKSLPSILTDWIPDIVFSILPIHGNEPQILGGLVVLFAIGLVTWVGSQLWNRWSQLDTEREYRGKVGSRASKAQVTFYVWSLLQLIFIATLAGLGPDPIGRAATGILKDRDDIVQAWASAYLWTIGVGLVAFLWASSPTRTSPRSAKLQVIGGIALALSLELVAVLISPRNLPGWVMIVVGIVMGVAAVLLIRIIWPWLQRLVQRVADFIEDPREKFEADDQATVIDYLGFIGLLLALVAVGLAFVMPIKDIPSEDRLWRFTAVLSFTAFACGLLLAVHTHGIREPEGGWLKGLLDKYGPVGRGFRALARMTMDGSPPVMRGLGVVTMVIAAVGFVAALSRLMALA
jgi:hypothetical protein